jgi:type III pantothenate kinase
MVAQDTHSDAEHHGSVRPLLAVCVGNSRTQFGLFRGDQLVESGARANDDGDLGAAMAAMQGDAAAVVGSVNPIAAARALEHLGGALLLGRDVPVHLQHALDDASTLGQDRILNAIAAYDRAQQACIVIDAGTAITVDFIDGEGVFHGGVIAPGLRMMLRALHDQTAALPEVELEPKVVGDERPFGRDTPDAMRKGVIGSARGLVREMAERYASFYDAYPQIVATGGDARLLFEDDGLVEHIVPELQLLGVRSVVERALAEPE